MNFFNSLDLKTRTQLRTQCPKFGSRKGIPLSGILLERAEACLFLFFFFVPIYSTQKTLMGGSGVRERRRGQESRGLRVNSVLSLIH